MCSRCALVLLLCLSTGLAAALIPVASAEELPSAAEELKVNMSTEAEAKQARAASSTTQDPEDDADWGLGSIRGSFQAVNGYFDSLLELMGGRDGVCQYRCRYGKQATLWVDVDGVVARFQFYFVSIMPLLAMNNPR